MKPTSNPIVFFGTEDFSAGSLQALLDGPFDVRLVVTKPDTRRGRGRQLTPPAVKQLALRHNIPVLQPARLAEIIPHIRALGRPTGVLVSFGRIIPQEIIDLFWPGIINLHPSLLPRYRGPSPVESALLQGDDVTGISIMQLSARMDAGPVYSQQRYRLRGDEQQAELYQALGQLGSQELIRVLPRIMAGQLQPTPQDESQASYCQLITKADAQPDPSQFTAQQLAQRVRAYSHHPRVRLPFYGQQRIITRAHVARQPGPTTLACAQGTHLAVDELIAPSGKQLAVADFLRGLPSAQRS